MVRHENSKLLKSSGGVIDHALYNGRLPMTKFARMIEYVEDCKIRIRSITIK